MYWQMIAWTQAIFQELYPNQEVKIKTESSRVVVLLSEVGVNAYGPVLNSPFLGTSDSVFVSWS